MYVVCVRDVVHFVLIKHPYGCELAPLPKSGEANYSGNELIRRRSRYPQPDDADAGVPPRKDHDRQEGLLRALQELTRSYEVFAHALPEELVQNMERRVGQAG